MSSSLLDLPPELLIHILAFLPLRSLIKFSEVSHSARLLSYSNLHTINLDFCPAPNVHLSNIYSSMRGIQPQPISIHKSRSPVRTNSEPINNTLNGTIQPPRRQGDKDKDPSKASVQIPDAYKYDYATLTNFQSALTSSIFKRHAMGLQNLDLTIWALTPPIAEAICNVSALRSLSIRLQHCPYTRAVPRSYILPQRREERKAWDLLARCLRGNERLTCLRVENAELDIEHVVEMLELSRCFKELSLKRCNYIGKNLWRFLASEWRGRDTLEVLYVAECGGMLDETGFAAIGSLRQLQYLDISGCVGARKKTIEELNNSEWHIACILPPKDRNLQDQILEVDPAYC